MKIELTQSPLPFGVHRFTDDSDLAVFEREAASLHCLSAFTVSLTELDAKDAASASESLHCLSAFTVSLTNKFKSEAQDLRNAVSIAFRRSPFH